MGLVKKVDRADGTQGNYVHLASYTIDRDFKVCTARFALYQNEPAFKKGLRPIDTHFDEVTFEGTVEGETYPLYPFTGDAVESPEEVIYTAYAAFKGWKP